MEVLPDERTMSFQLGTILCGLKVRKDIGDS